jgi:hypothetical protein
MARPYTPRQLISAGVLLVCSAALFHVFSPDRLILFPTRDPRSSQGAIRRAIPFQGGDLEVFIGHSQLRPPGTPAAFCMLRFYGNADRADTNVGLEAASWSAAPSVEIWGVNYPGYGGSTGPARLGSIGPAALAAYDALKEQAAGRPIVAFGTSLGTTPALYIATKRPLAGLILQNPPPLRQIVLRQFGWWNLWLLAGPVALGIPSALDSVSNARNAHVPCAFLLAQDDEVVRPRYQKLVADAYTGPKRIIPLPNANHNDPLDSGETGQLNAAVEWMLGIKAAPARTVAGD